MFKNLFGGSRTQPPDERASIDDLIVLERYEDATGLLKKRLKRTPGDRHARLRLADTYVAMNEPRQAIDEYVHLADEYARDGFYDQGIALLLRAEKVAPGSQELAQRVERLRVTKSSERSREHALEGLREGRPGGASTALLVQQAWHDIAPAPLIRHLTPELLKHLFSAMTLVQFEGGDVLAAAESADERLYFLLAGIVGARAPEGGPGAGATLRDFGPGDLIGESALLERTPWRAEYRAAEPGRALALDREGLEATLVGNPDPRGFLLALRVQHHDREVARTLQALSRS